MLKKIYFNIWDDYWDDGCAPDGEIQTTSGRLENHSDSLTPELESNIIAHIYEHILSLNLNINCSCDDDSIYFNDLSHSKREELVKQLQIYKSNYQGIPIEFYSES